MRRLMSFAFTQDEAKDVWMCLGKCGFKLSEFGHIYDGSGIYGFVNREYRPFRTTELPGEPDERLYIVPFRRNTLHDILEEYLASRRTASAVDSSTSEQSG